MPPSRRKKSEVSTSDTKELQPEEVAIKTKSIDPRLISQAEDIEKQNPNLSVLVARQFCYKVLQIPVELAVSEPRKFNVLEEFILRASIEFTPPPTVEELANVLGLDLVFVRSAAENLESLKILEVSFTGKIYISPSGREFYKQGSVSHRQTTKQIYAIADPFQDKITFQFETLPEGRANFPDFVELLPIEYPSLQDLTIEDFQQLTQASALGIHVPEEGKIITNFRISGKPQTSWRTISIFVFLLASENRYKIQLRQGQQILEKASNWLTDLESQQKISLKDLCQFTGKTSTATEKPKAKTQKTRKRKSENSL
jgi:hypothetical protein